LLEIKQAGKEVAISIVHAPGFELEVLKERMKYLEEKVQISYNF